MDLNPYDMGACGMHQMLCAGHIAFDTTGADTGVTLYTLPAGTIITKAVAVVDTAFDAATANVLTVGINDDCDNLLGSGDITEDTAGVYSKDTFLKLTQETAIKAKYTQTGTAASAGTATIYLSIVRVPI